MTPRHPATARTTRALAIATAAIALGCGRDGPTEGGAVPVVPCQARLARPSTGEIVYAGLTLGNADRPALDWSGDGATLMVRVIPNYDPCGPLQQSIAPPVVLALSVDRRESRPVLPLTGETAPGVLTQGGRAVLYLTPTAKVAGLDVYGLVRASFDGRADTLLRDLPRPAETGVDSGGRVVAWVVPGAFGFGVPPRPDTLVAVDVATGARRAVRVLQPVGHTVRAMDPEGTRVWVGTVIVRLADGAILGTVPFGGGPGAARERLAAVRWRADGIDLLLHREADGFSGGHANDAFDVLRAPEGTRRRVARLRGSGSLGAFDWLADGSLLAVERLVDEEVPPPDPSRHGAEPWIVGAVRRFAPGDTVGRELLRGRFASPPGQVRATPDGRRFALASPQVVIVAPLR
jgi:hypothetical protein